MSAELDDELGYTRYDYRNRGLRNRGVEDILIACVDGLTGFSNAIEAVFPKTEIQQCIIHQIRNTTRFVSYKDIRSLMADLKRVYTAPTEDAALSELATFEKNGAKNIQKFRIPGETTGRNSRPIPNIARKFEPSFIQLIPSRD